MFNYSIFSSRNLICALYEEFKKSYNEDYMIEYYAITQSLILHKLSVPTWTKNTFT